jgi:hypothetical protein
MSGSRDPRLPWNYILIAPRSFNFVILNPDTLSHWPTSTGLGIPTTASFFVTMQ